MEILKTESLQKTYGFGDDAVRALKLTNLTINQGEFVALASKPKIIFADEPTGNLDGKNSREVLQLITQSIKKYNQTLVMITHDPKVSEVSDRIIIIDDGNIVEDKKVTLCGAY